ncbi:DNA alkylation repair protein [Candidatus Latescibacterota bacterium]
MKETIAVDDIIRRLDDLEDPGAARGMARYGISAAKVWGIRIPVLRALAREIGKNRDLALDLWQVNARETRILAGMIDEPSLVTETQMDAWAGDFDSWEVCDQVIMCDFEKTPFAWEKAVEWSAEGREFVKRAGFVMMARLAVSDKKVPDEAFERFFPLIIREASDNRNYVKKAVNWALRQIGKRSRCLHARAIAVAGEVNTADGPNAKWIASDALRELTGGDVIARLRQ